MTQESMVFEITVNTHTGKGETRLTCINRTDEDIIKAMEIAIKYLQNNIDGFKRFLKDDTDRV